MQAVVLVGGEGTRLRPLTLTRPKPALPLVDRPFIRYMVEWLARHGIDEVIMACGFQAEALRVALGDELESGVRIRYVEEDEPLGTAGPVRLAADMGFLGERFMVLNGDVLTDLDLTALQGQHDETGATSTLALYPVDDPSAVRARAAQGRPVATGREHRGPGGEVLGFLEKPDPDADRHRRGQRRRLRARAHRARPDPRRAGGLDRARGLPPARRPGPLRPPPRGLLDGHRDPGALPAGELGHPRGRGRNRRRRDRPRRFGRGGCGGVRTRRRSARARWSGPGARSGIARAGRRLGIARGAAGSRTRPLWRIRSSRPR